jgi:outer membrane protein TolC
MKASRVFVIALVALASLFVTAPAQAQIKTNFVKDFLARYRPSNVQQPGTPGSAQGLQDLTRAGQLPLTMGDLINLMLQNNLDINVNRYSPLSSQYVIATMYRPFEPTMHLQASVGRSTNPATTILAGAANPSTLTGSYNIGFAQTLTTGSIVGVDATMSRSSSNSNFSTLNPSWTGSLRYSFTQHLAQNFGRDVNLHSVRVAQTNQKISESNFERQLIDLVAQAQRSYWDLVFAAEDIKVKQRSVDLAQKTLSDNEVQVRIGTLAPIDVIQSKSEVANRKLAFVSSTYTEVQTQDQVKKLITNQGDPGMILAKLAPAEGVRMPQASDVLPIEEEIKIALENRPEMKQLQLDLESKKLDTSFLKNQLLPTVDFVAQYTQTGVAGAKAAANPFFGTTSTVNPDLIGGVGTTFNEIFGCAFPLHCNYTSYSVGFSVQIPLRNRAAQGDYSRALTDQHTSEQKLTAQAQQIALEVRNALTQVDMNKAKIEAATTARELAEQQLGAEQKKFELGASTIRFVLEEQRNVAQAQTDELQALVNYTKSLVDLDHSTGMTLKKNNIEIEKTLNSGAVAR